MDIHLYWYINIWYIGIPRCAHTKSPHFARRFHPGADAMSPSRSSTASSPRSAASSSDEPMAPVSQGGKPWSHGYPMDIPRDIRDIPWNPYIFVGETNHHRRSLFFCGNQLLCCLKLVISTEMSLSNLLVNVPFWGFWTSCSGICWKLDQKKCWVVWKIKIHTSTVYLWNFAEGLVHYS